MAKIFGVIGKPVLHSKSPAIFNSVLDSGEYYLRFAVDSCKEALSLSSELPIVGFNITSPFKFEAYQQSQVISESAKETTSVNTLLINSKTQGSNSDVDGVIGALKEIPVEGKTVLVLGAGGAASAACYATKILGGNLFVWNRTPSKTESLILKYDAKLYSPNENLAVDIVISTVPSTKELFDTSGITSSTVILDAVYGKETWIKSVAAEKNSKFISGESWLLEQAKSSASILLGRESKINSISKYKKTISPKRIFLLGLMGVGKSSCGHILAQKQNLKFYDLDMELENRERCSIAEIISNKGEAYFRAKEAEILKEFSEREGIFATGGGVIEREESRLLLNSIPSLNVWLCAKTSTLQKRIESSDRPLAKNLSQFSQSRISHYAECSDLILSSETRSPENCAQRISYEICETWAH